MGHGSHLRSNSGYVGSHSALTDSTPSIRSQRVRTASFQPAARDEVRYRSPITSKSVAYAHAIFQFGRRFECQEFMIGCTKWNFKFRVTQFNSNRSHSRLVKRRVDFDGGSHANADLHLTPHQRRQLHAADNAAQSRISDWSNLIC